MKTFYIPDMSCGHCKSTVEKTIHALDPEARVDFDMEARQIALDTRTETMIVQTALAAAKYPATAA